MSSGLFCVLEGIDGSGKSTLLKTITSRFQNRMPGRVLALREPTDGPAGREIRRLLGGPETVNEDVWLRLFLEDRRENLAFNIAPAKERGDLILQDRYFYSTAAYQGTNENDAKRILQIHRHEGFPEPDLLVYLELPVRVALERISSGRESLEYFETGERLEQIASRYRQILPEKTSVLDASLSPDVLADRLETLILDRFADLQGDSGNRGW